MALLLIGFAKIIAVVAVALVALVMMDVLLE